MQHMMKLNLSKKKDNFMVKEKEGRRNGE